MGSWGDGMLGLSLSTGHFRKAMGTRHVAPEAQIALDHNRRLGEAMLAEERAVQIWRPRRVNACSRVRGHVRSRGMTFGLIPKTPASYSRRRHGHNADSALPTGVRDLHPPAAKPKFQRL